MPIPILVLLLLALKVYNFLNFIMNILSFIDSHDQIFVQSNVSCKDADEGFYFKFSCIILDIKHFSYVL